MMNELLHNRPEVQPLATCSSRSCCVTVAGGEIREKAGKENGGEAGKENGGEGRKRKSSVKIVERERHRQQRHDEKMENRREFLDLMKQMIDKL